MRMILVLWVLSSMGIAGIVTAMSHKPQNTTTVQKTVPTHNINRLLRADKLKPEATKPQPAPVRVFQNRKYWHA